MRLLGRWNWWAPAPLRRLHERIGLREPVDPDGDGTLEASADGAGNRRSVAEVVQ
jgi:RND superfamily putative drug exporter